MPVAAQVDVFRALGKTNRLILCRAPQTVGSVVMSAGGCAVKKPRTRYRRNSAQGRGSNHPGWPTVLHALLVSVFRLLLDATVARRRADTSGRVDVLVVRHQPRV